MPASTRVRVAFEKSMEKGLLVEEMVRLESELVSVSAAEMIQLKVAWALVGDVAYVTEGSHFQLSGLEVQFVEVVSRKVVNV